MEGIRKLTIRDSWLRDKDTGEIEEIWKVKKTWDDLSGENSKGYVELSPEIESDRRPIWFEDEKGGDGKTETDIGERGSARIKVTICIS